LSTRLVVGQNLACFTQAAGNAATSLQVGKEQQQQQQQRQTPNLLPHVGACSSSNTPGAAARAALLQCMLYSSRTT
jgi:hypothetical protein